MGLFNSIGYNFSTDFFESGKLLSFYSLEGYDLDKQTEGENINKIHTVDLIPPFFDLKIKENYAAFKYDYLGGFAVKLAGHSSMDDYLTKNFRKKNKKTLLKRLRKLEGCFDIKYVMYKEDISKDKYFILLNELKNMIIRRFNQRNETHGNLQYWDFYTKTCFDMIKSKKACIYVTYNDNKPIAISINYLFNGIFESAISSYDIDFAKFGLGNMEVFKKLEWCFDNDYDIFNTRWGDYPYKHEWCNWKYKYQSNVIYKKGSVIGFFKALPVLLKNKSILFAIDNKELLVKIKLIKKKENSHGQIEQKHVVLKNDDQLSEVVKSDFIDLNNEKYAYLKKPVYDFLYISNEALKNIKVYEQAKNIFFIEGLSKSQLIECKY